MLAGLLAVASCSNSNGGGGPGGAEGGLDGTTSCGGSGEPCCNGTACNAGLTCAASTCSGSSSGSDAATASGSGSGSGSSGSSPSSGSSTGGSGTDASGSGSSSGDAAVADGSSDASAADACSATGNLQSDSHNCGACGHDCLGGACSGGKCGVAAVIDNDGLVGAIAADATGAYWVAKGNGNGAIRHVAATSAQITTVATNQLAPAGVSADGTYFYFSTQGNFDAGYTGGNVYSCPAAGCGSSALLLGADNGAATQVPLNATSVFWSSSPNSGQSGYIESSPKDGGGAVPIVSVLNANVAADNNNVYWASDTTTSVSILREPLSGGAAVTLYSKTSTLAQAFVADSSAVYWIEQASPNVIKKCLLPDCVGGASTVMTVADSFASALAVDATQIYWPESGALKTAATSCTPSTCTAATLAPAPTGGGSTQGIAIFGGVVYWTWDGSGAGHVSRLVR